MRTTSSSDVIKILPSPIFPVAAAAMMVKIEVALPDDQVDGAVETIIAYFSGGSSGDDGLHRPIDLIVRESHLDLHLRQKVHHILCPAIQLGMALLSSESLDLGDRNALHTDAP